MDLKDLEERLLKKAKFRKEFSRVDLAWEISKMLIDIRVFRGVTQSRLAKLLKTKQPSIARAESGQFLPSLRFLENIAKALGTGLLPPRFAFLEEHNRFERQIYSKNIAVKETSFDIKSEISVENESRNTKEYSQYLN